MATGNPTPTYALGTGAPTWLSINSTSGAVSGTPPTGTTTFSYSVIAANGVTPNATAGPFTVTVSPAPAAPTFTTDSPPLTATVGTQYSYTFVATGNPTPTYALGTGAPSWLSINSTSGAVSGTPPTGTTTFTYSVIAANGVTPNATAGPFTVTVTGTSSKTPTSTKVSSSANPVYTTQAVTFTATVSPTNGGGSVAFFADGSSSPIPGCGAISLVKASGSTYTATCSTTALEVGVNTVTATYSGDTSYLGSTGSLSQNEQVIGCPSGQAAHLLTATTNVGTIYGLFCVNPKTGAGTYQQGSVSGTGTVVIKGASSVISAVGKNLGMGGTSNGTTQGAGNVFQENLPIKAKGVYTLG